MKTLAGVIADPPTWLPWVLLVLLVVLIAVMGLTLWWLLRRKEGGDAKDESAPPPPTAGDADPDDPRLVKHMRREVRRSLQTLAELSDNGGNPYSVPWIVAAGAENAHLRAVIDGIDPESTSSGGTIPRAGVVRFCRQGAVFHAGDSLLSQSEGPRRWRRLVRLMGACRPHRPVDGLVLAIPVGMLAGAEALPFDRLADQGARFSDMIASVQRITGLRVPVTVVLTQCEDLRGFSALAAALSDQARADALGWAVPYSLETAYQADWAEQATESISTGLANTGIHLLMAGDRPADADGIMVLPFEVKALTPSLKPLLAAMFQPSAYHESFLFRGLYLTGTPTGQDDAMAFATGLFNGKVFREYQLVRPVRGILTARTRRLRMAQAVLAAAVVLGALGLSWLSFDAPRRVRVVRPLLATIQNDLGQIVRLNGRVDPALGQAASIRLLKEMSRLDVVTLTTIFAPGSYLHHPDRLIQKAISIGYDDIIMAEIQRRLSTRLNAILNADTPAGRTDTESVQQLTQLVNQLVEFDRIYRTYLDLPNSRSAAALSTVVRYALDIDLPSGFQTSARLYQGALAYSSVHSIDHALPLVARGLTTQFAASYRTRFDAGHLRSRLERINQLSLGSNDHNPEAAMARLMELQDQLKAVARDLDSRDYGWINGEKSDLGSAMEGLLVKLDGLSVVPSGIVAALRQTGEQQMAEARRQLFSLLVNDKVPLLQLEGGKALLSPAMVALRKQLDDLLARSFMSQAMPSLPPLATGARPILWDAQWLKAAQAVIDDYLAFITTEAQKFPAALSFTVEMAAFDQASQRAEVATAAAARPAERVSSGLYQVETEMQGLISVSQTLASLGEQLRRAKMDWLGVQLKGTVQSQGARLLGEVDGMASGLLLAAHAPSFDWWDGSMPLAARTFRAASLPELSIMVESNHESLSRLARDDADPLLKTVAALPGEGGGGDIVAKWQGIVRALHRYDQKDRDSSLRRLEQFMLVDMDQIDPGRCDTIAGGPPTPGGDIFAIQLDQLRASLALRCSELGAGHIRARYARIQALFNELLAGRFPFASDALPQTPRADPLAVRRFFWAMDQEKPPPRPAVETAVGRSAGSFMTALAASKKALAPMLVDPTLEQPLIYEVEAEFRANAARDTAGNQIIEWGLDLGGEQRLSSLEPKRKAIWSTGQPVRLFVRFARNAPSLPVADARRRYRVDGAVASWEASDPWALLSLMAMLATEPGRLAELPDRRSHSLTLNMDLQRNPDAAAGARAAATAEMFLRLGLTAVVRQAGKPEERIPVVLPLFPPAAPVAESTTPILLLPRE